MRNQYIIGIDKSTNEEVKFQVWNNTLNRIGNWGGVIDTRNGNYLTAPEFNQSYNCSGIIEEESGM